MEKTTESQASDDRHLYFIGVLEHVRDTLRPLMPESLKNIEPETKPADAEKLSNLFDKLGLFEPSEDFLNAPDATPSAPGEPPSAARYETERLQDFKEAFLLFQLLVQDMGKIRAVILETWSGYKMGMFDLVSASVTTNTAVDIARRMEEDTQPILDKHGGSEKRNFCNCCILATALNTKRNLTTRKDQMTSSIYEYTTLQRRLSGLPIFSWRDSAPLLKVETTFHNTSPVTTERTIR